MNSILKTLPNSRHWLLTKPYAAIDTEFKINYHISQKPYTLFAASIVDSTGVAQSRHITDFQEPKPEKELVKWLMDQILKYRLTVGWYSKGVKIIRKDGTSEGKDSDLKVIDSVCRYYDIPSIVDFDILGLPYVAGYRVADKVNQFPRYYHIDLYQIYKKPLVKSIIYNNKYKSLRLDQVCLAILGEGKLDELDGSKIYQLPKEKQLEYVTQDAALVMKLSQYNNYQILDLMNEIANLTKLKFEKVCHTQISTWWRKIIQDQIDSGGCKSTTGKLEKKKYSGGHVMEPTVGFYTAPVHLLDVKSLYPSMMISHNISIETVNCQCCKNDPEARVSDDIMRMINSNVPKTDYRKRYWICKDPNYKGIVPRLLKQFREERFKQQAIGNEATQLALKNLINGCYGIFGSKFFEYADYRVAELTTAYGRQALRYMQDIGKQVYDFNVIYGDTDSLFITEVKKENDVMKFIAECSILLDIDVEISDIYKKFLITKKKHYIGIPADGTKDPVIKGMEGMKSDRPRWINRIEAQFADDIRFGKDPCLNICNELSSLESGQVSLQDLEINLSLAKNPNDYPRNRLQRIVGSELNARQGDIIKYYKSTLKGGGTSRSHLLSQKKYLEMLENTFKDSLRVMGYDFDVDIVGQTRLS